MKMDAHASLLEKLLPIAHHAGNAIMNIYGGNIDVRTKSDASPVTEADELAEALILPAW
jgi:3'(2'), 5'-bisphosphate nucleotidase